MLLKKTLISKCSDDQNIASRVTTDLENLEKSGNLKETSEIQGICNRIPKVREFCCLIFIFSEVEDPNSPPPPPPNGLGLKVSKKLGNFVLSGKWPPCASLSCCHGDQFYLATVLINDCLNYEASTYINYVFK